MDNDKNKNSFFFIFPTFALVRFLLPSEIRQSFIIFISLRHYLLQFRIPRLLFGSKIFTFNMDIGDFMGSENVPLKNDIKSSLCTKGLSGKCAARRGIFLKVDVV